MTGLTALSLELLANSAPVSIITSTSFDQTIRSRSSSLSSISSLSSLSDSSEDERPRRTSPKRRRKVVYVEEEEEEEEEEEPVETRWSELIEEPNLDGKEYRIEGLYAPPKLEEEIVAVADDVVPVEEVVEVEVIAEQPEIKSRRASALIADSKLARPPPSIKSSKPVTIDNRLILPFSFTLPINYGHFLINETRAFRLPFDIGRDLWFDGATARVGLKGAERRQTLSKGQRHRLEKSRKPDKYKKIIKNIYVERRAEKAEIPAICQCKLPSNGELGCGDNCLNRLMQYSCDVKLCPLGNRCSNLPFNEREGIVEGNGGIKVIYTGNRGFGLKTTVPIKSGTFVMEYRGEIITRDESYKRVLTVYQDSKSFYFLNYDGSEVVDAGTKGNSARFINHSCGPNLSIERWKLSDYDEYQIGVFAKEDIEADTELTYDYGWQDFSSILPSVAPVTATALNAPVASTSNLTTSTTPSVVDLTNASPIPAVVVDPARQKCYCGSGFCSGYLGRKENKKVNSKDIKGKGKAKVVEKSGKKTRTIEKVEKIIKKVMKKVERTIVGSRRDKKETSMNQTGSMEDIGKVEPETKRKEPRIRG